MTVGYVGGDPGLSGAIALYVPSEAVLQVIDMPTITVGEPDSRKRVVDMWRLAQQLGAWADDWELQATVERVHAMPGQGVTSMFSFGFAAGSLQQALASARIHVTLVHPATWKAIYGLRGGRENKDMSRAKASHLFPKHCGLWARKKDDGRAEAVLLAHYGSKLQCAPTG